MYKRQDLRRFDRVDALLALPDSQAYELLVNLEPRLAAVALQAESFLKECSLRCV